jgi:Fic family protein
MQSLVNAESVQYSTKIEGNTLTLKEVTSSLSKRNKN